ncbi:MAG: acyl carrier protein [Candidatus Wallbacteria bacterium]|nr:acyl carrier protein [Candidatus Wallbacteria bacterium]
MEGNSEKLYQTFAAALGVDRSLVTDDLQYNKIAQWDSIAHMSLVAQLETAFDIMLETEDIIDMSSVKKAKEILEKYDVRF